MHAGPERWETLIHLHLARNSKRETDPDADAEDYIPIRAKQR